MRELIAELEARAPALVERVLREMYANPFWDERFGERGRTFARQDGHYHIDHLVVALRFEVPALLTRYARWLQVTLTTRGMCSRHLAENYARLAQAIHEELPVETGAAVTYLREAEEALIYQEGPARLLQLAAERLADDCSSILFRRHPGWLGHGGEQARRRCHDDFLYHLSYLADAIANEQPAHFAAYLTWIKGFLARRGVPEAHLQEALIVLEESLESLDPEARDVARQVCAAARAEVWEGQA
jgi:hypothetical protein